MPKAAESALAVLARVNGENVAHDEVRSRWHRIENQ
jgi:hypothetical protein